MIRALASGYLAQAYVSAVGILMMPVYLGYVGAEGLGLIGFFVMIQGLLPLLDLGLSPLLLRDMSRYRAGIVGGDLVRARLRLFEGLLGLLAMVVVLLTVLLKQEIASSWLQVGSIGIEEAEHGLVAMSMAAVARWLGGVHRSALVGLEQHTSVNRIAVAFATIRHIGVVAVLIWYAPTITTFFVFQALSAIIELLVLRLVAYRALPLSVGGDGLGPLIGFRDIWAMAGPITFLSVIWIAFNQADKLILSTMLSLADFGRYSLAVSLASSLLMLMPPLAQVLQPRMTTLCHLGHWHDLGDLYRTASQGVAALFAAAGGVLAVLGQPLLFAWIGDPRVADEVAPILAWYGSANAITALLSLPYMLQLARGQLRLHVVGNLLLGIVMLPALVLVARDFGAMGAGAVIFLSWLLFLLLWVPRVHRSLLPGVAQGWLGRDVMPGILAALTVLLAVKYLPAPESRIGVGAMVVMAGAAALAAGLLAGDLTRRVLRTWWLKESA